MYTQKILATLSLLSLIAMSTPVLLFAQTEPTADYIIVTAPATTSTVESILDSVGATDSDAVKISQSNTIFGVSKLTKEEAQDLENSDVILLVQKNEYRTIALASSVPVSEINALYNLSGLTGNAGKGAPYSIAIFDTGVMKTHGMLSGKVVYEICSSANPNFTGSGGGAAIADPLANAVSSCTGGTFRAGVTDAALPCSFADCYHGTHVASIAAGKANPTANPAGNSTLTGLAPSANIVAVQVFTFYIDPDGAVGGNSVSAICGAFYSCLSASDADIIKALDHLYTRITIGGNPDNIRALNFSLGGGIISSETICANANPAYEYYFNLFKLQGIPTFVASGNEFSSSGISAPACVPSAIAIASSNDNDTRSSFANIDFNNISLDTDFISGTKKFITDFFVPGNSITAAAISGTNDYSTISGTSMASPYAAGLYTSLASLFNGTQTGYPVKTMSQITTALKLTGQKIFKPLSTVMYIPRMNAKRAMNNLKGVLPTAIFTATTPSNVPIATSAFFTDDVGFFCDQLNCADTIIPTTLTNGMISGFACTLAVDTLSITCDYTVNQGGTANFTVKDSGALPYSATYTYEIGPMVQSFTTTQATETTIGTNATVTIEANFDKQLDVGSTMSIVLSNGGSVTLGTISNNSGANTGKLSGAYTVGLGTLGANTYTLNVLSISSSNTIELGQPARISVATTLPATNISPTKTVTIDVKPPVVSVLTIKSNNTNNPNLALAGEKIRLVITTDEPLRTTLSTPSPTYTTNSNYTIPSVASQNTLVNISVVPTTSSSLYTYTIDSANLILSDSGQVSLQYNIYDLYGNVLTQTGLIRGTDNSWAWVNPVNNFVTTGTTTNLTDVNLVTSQSALSSDANFSTIGTKARTIALDSRLSFLSAISGMTASTETNINVTKLPLTLLQNTASSVATVLLNGDQTDTTKKNVILSIPSGVSQTSQPVSTTIQQPTPLTTTPTLPAGTFMTGIDIPTSLPLTFSGKIEICLFNDTSKITTTNATNIAVYSSQDGTSWIIDSSVLSGDKYFTGSGNSLFCFKPNHLTKFALSNITPATPIQNIGITGGSGGGGGGGTTTILAPKIETPKTKTFCDFDIKRPITQGVYNNSNDVKLVKSALYDLGFYNGTISNNFDSSTVESLKAFQKKMKVTETGIVDDVLWYALRFSKGCQISVPRKTSIENEYAKKTVSTHSVPVWTGALKKNSSNKQTTYVINRLVELKFISVSELISIPLTKKEYKIDSFVQTKIKAFQKSAKLKETGNINKPTWNKLIGN